MRHLRRLRQRDRRIVGHREMRVFQEPLLRLVDAERVLRQREQRRRIPVGALPEEVGQVGEDRVVPELSLNYSGDYVDAFPASLFVP